MIKTNNPFLIQKQFQQKIKQLSKPQKETLSKVLFYLLDVFPRLSEDQLKAYCEYISNYEKGKVNNV